jgi:pilus assembly protein Flp/PilA
MLSMYTDLEVRVRDFARSVARKDEGAGLVEYALLVALIAIALIAALVFLRGGIGAVFSKAANTLA